MRVDGIEVFLFSPRAGDGLTSKDVFFGRPRGFLADLLPVCGWSAEQILGCRWDLAPGAESQRIIAMEITTKFRP